MTYASVKNSRMLRTVALAACALLMVAGCAGSPGNDSSSSTTPSSAESETPSPTATPTPSYKPASAEGPAENVPVPEMPAVAKEHTEEGFEAFVKYYFELLNYSNEVRSTDKIAPITNSNCGTCSKLLNNIVHNAESDRWMVGGAIHNADVYTDMRKDTQGFIWGLTKFDQDASSDYSESQGLIVEFDKAEDVRWQIQLKPTDGGWIVVDMGATK